LLHIPQYTNVKFDKKISPYQGFQGFFLYSTVKDPVVASKTDSTPRYPENGYYTYITDSSIVSCNIYPGDEYQSGDFDGKFKSGQEYFFSITAVFGDKKIPGNAVKLKMP